MAELRQNLSRYLKAAQASEELLITDRGQPVARIILVTGAHAEDAHVRGLVRAGILRPRTRGLREDFWARPRLGNHEGAILEALLRGLAEGL